MLFQILYSHYNYVWSGFFFKFFLQRVGLAYGSTPYVSATLWFNSLLINLINYILFVQPDTLCTIFWYWLSLWYTYRYLNLYILYPYSKFRYISLNIMEYKHVIECRRIELYWAFSVSSKHQMFMYIYIYKKHKKKKHNRDTYR